MFFANEAFIRIICFAVGLTILLVVEKLFPKREYRHNRTGRWKSNIALVFLNTILIRVIFPVLAVETAFLAEEAGWGLFNTYAVPFIASFIIGFLLLDMSVYFTHIAFHKIKFLWALHKVHHTDLDLDVTTGLRFHPFEIFISMGIKILIVVLFGLPFEVVITFEIILNLMFMFTHANLNLPYGLEKVTRYLFVTPDMHRIHHSMVQEETNSNYGFNFSLWDRLFLNYRAFPAAGHYKMQIGLKEYRDIKLLGFYHLLKLPFQKQ
jgi:sterol desaturase/sphingolipid hydroxylase (fatty acid hydroxylase superfamily)